MMKAMEAQIKLAKRSQTMKKILDSAESNAPEATYLAEGHFGQPYNFRTKPEGHNLPTLYVNWEKLCALK